MLGRPARPPPPVDFAVIPTGMVVRIVGIDGLDRRMAEEMIARGEMPHLQALLAASAHAPLRAEPEQVPAIVWTTIATGRGPAVHGIHSAGARHLPGMRTPVPLADRTRFSRAVGAAADLLRLTRTQPASSVLRGAKAFWNVASEKGLRVLVVNWWATWPADRVNGQIVTDRALLKLEKGGRPDRETHPDDLLERLRALAAADAPPDRARRIDGFAAAVARMLHHSAPVADLEAVYLPGLDIVTMQQLGDAAGAARRRVAAGAHGRGARPSPLRRRAARRPARGHAGERRAAARGRSRPARAAVRNARKGCIVLSGANIAAGPMAAGGERDVAPTVLHLLGLPVSDELEGSVLEAALSPAFRAAHPVRRVAVLRPAPAGPARGRARSTARCSRSCAASGISSDQYGRTRTRGRGRGRVRGSGRLIASPFRRPSPTSQRRSSTWPRSKPRGLLTSATRQTWTSTLPFAPRALECQAASSAARISTGRGSASSPSGLRTTTWLPGGPGHVHPEVPRLRHAEGERVVVGVPLADEDLEPVHDLRAVAPAPCSPSLARMLQCPLARSVTDERR